MLRCIIDAYGAPDRTFNDMRQNVQREQISDPPRNFSEDCRANWRIGPVNNARFGAEVFNLRTTSYRAAALRARVPLLLVYDPERAPDQYE